MAAEPTTDRSLPAQLAELWDLVRAYAKQETVEPIKGLGRSAAFGVAGSLLVSIGLVLLVLAGLRALQTETGTTFTGNWSWAPYLITLAGSAIVMMFLLRFTRKRKA
ncbi:MAG TPA: hypothetical protein VM262_18005 [Acidimicrobiales bacterium]|nr:hypothetical protein [Acidimicrobiales bacterium]